MKKFIFSILMMISILIPINVMADTQVLDLKDTLAAEQIEMTYKDYSENEDQITIYMFRQDGCSHCRDFLKFLDSIALEYGEMFKLRSFEVSNSDNQRTKEKVVNFFHDNAPGVPYIVIGESTFYGYGDQYADEVKEAIKAEYEAKEKYDVFEEMEKIHSPNDALYILVPIALIGIICVAVKMFKKEDEK